MGKEEYITKKEFEELTKNYVTKEEFTNLTKIIIKTVAATHEMFNTIAKKMTTTPTQRFRTRGKHLSTAIKKLKEL